MVGGALMRELRKRGKETITVGRSSDDDVFLDLERPSDNGGRQVERVDVAFLCAAAFGNDEPDGLRANVQVNVGGAERILEWCAGSSVRSLVYAGSVSSSFPASSPDLNSYGLTKRFAEELLAWGMERRDGMFCSLRFPQIYDTEGACCRHQPWFGRIVAYASRGRDLNMPRSLGKRNFLHAEDAATLLIEAAERKISGVYNVVHPVAMSYDEIAEIAYATFGKGGAPKHADGKAPFRHVDFPSGDAPFDAMIAMRSMADGIAAIRDCKAADAFGPMDVS